MNRWFNPQARGLAFDVDAQRLQMSPRGAANAQVSSLNPSGQTGSAAWPSAPITRRRISSAPSA